MAAQLATHAFPRAVIDAVASSVTSSSASATSTLRATPQGGILEGSNPTQYDSKNPIILFIIQAGIIILFCRLLHWPLSKIRQPRVIAEVIGGILLGPSVMGRIPHFTDTIFPAAAMPNLSLVANLGLVLFLFLVGLEVDLRFLASNWRVATSVGLAGMALPFGLGCAISWGLYNEFRNEPGIVEISFPVYMLFIGVAMAITAFPVLCRILTELKLLQTPVGIIVLSAGVGNDVVGWVLLALCVALVNAGTGLTALWVLLTCIAYVLFLAFAVRPAFLWVLRRSRTFEEGPSQSIIALTLIIALASSFFTGVIGVHPIFGAFLAGLICPHEGGFAIKVTEKVEDLVSALFLPLYFALSGLNTNVGLLDSGIVWAYVVGVIAVAFCAKFVGAALAARASGLLWRESFTIGSLMSCKGLVELIVLNIGLQAHILSSRTFTIFVVMALITTFATTPLTAAFYPPWYQRKLEAWKRGEIDWETGAQLDSSETSSTRNSVAYEKLEATRVRKVLMYLRLDNMSSIIAFMSLLGGNHKNAQSERIHPRRASELDVSPVEEDYKRPVQAHGLRLLELTERNSSVMQVAELDEYSVHDPLVNTFRNVGRLQNVAVSGEVTVLPESGYAEALTHRADDMSSDLLVLPWTASGSLSDAQAISSDPSERKLFTAPYIEFASGVLANASCNVALFVSRNFGGSNTDRPALGRTKSSTSFASNYGTMLQTPLQDKGHHIFCPFIGGPSDRAAVRLVLQMAENPDITATIVHFRVADAELTIPGVVDDEVAELEDTGSSSVSPKSKASTSRVAQAVSSESRDDSYFASVRATIPMELSPRVEFSIEDVQSSTGSALVHAIITRADSELGLNPRNAGDLVVLGRRMVGLSSTPVRDGLPTGVTLEAVDGCLGTVGASLLRSKVKGSVIVMQSKNAPL